MKRLLMIFAITGMIIGMPQNLKAAEEPKIRVVIYNSYEECHRLHL